jgi:hypothetical protein
MAGNFPTGNVSNAVKKSKRFCLLREVNEMRAPLTTCDYITTGAEYLRDLRIVVCSS